MGAPPGMKKLIIIGYFQRSYLGAGLVLVKKNGCSVTRRRTSKPPYSGLVGFWGRLGTSSNRMIGRIGTGKEK
jgi:hypothetical protein